MYCWEAASSFEICSLSASAKLLSAICRSFVGGGSGRTLPLGPLTPAEAALARLRRQRAGRQPRLLAGRVVAGRRRVVRGVGVEDRRQVLDLPAARAELPLAATVGADVAVGAVVVGCEQSAQG